MNADARTDVDVVVVGGGPVGLMLACELRLGGARVTVLERLTEVDPTIKAGSITTPTAEAFYRRGMLPALAEVQEEALRQFRAFRWKQEENADPEEADRSRSEAQAPPPRFAGHFAGIMLRADRFDDSDPVFRSAGPAGDVGFVSQQEIERVLAERAELLGVELRRGVELTGFEAGDDGVTVRLARADGGEALAPLRASWLVGCDGGRSLVRKLAGFDFPGTPPLITGHQAIVEMTGTEELKPGWNWTRTGTYANGPGPRVLTVEFDGPPADREAPVTAEELQAGMRAVSGVDVTVTKVHTATRFTDNARQVTDYRAGRVLLAGDAAHVHAPFGGQGLNLGVGDAMNLGWKLAAVVRGRAPEGLLDSYTAERHPIGAWVLDWTRAQVALMRPEPHTHALRDVVAGLTDTTEGTTYLVKRISGVLQRYDLPGDHELIGRSAPDLEVKALEADGGSDGRLAGLLGAGRGLLLDLAGDPALRARTTGYGDRVDTVTAACPDRPELAALLVRPDGITAWAADADRTDASEAALDALTEALTRWFGAPAQAQAQAPTPAPATSSSP
ncbi:FAD-dependent oxidoreductase [Streptomyces sp. 150FB]|uniref:FAD-dependent oxidoreductase n=1 Tax=Streptomyces sp. 150FB TaxID=1576605 RepID=UPI000697BFBE|nr:FAD-dependent oxidoreductase [Streptomyces sp. 150FB]